MTNQQNLAVVQPNAETLEQVIVKGDLSSMNPAQKVSYYQAVCASVGLNPLTRPLAYLKLNNELQLYVTKSATDQLRKLYQVSIKIVSRELIGDLYIVTAQAWLPDGRQDESTGVVDTKGKAGDFLSNLYMKAESKAKRRATLSICGLGFLSADEAESIPGAEMVSDVQSEPQPVKRISSLEQFKASPATAMAMIEQRKRLNSLGVSDDEIKSNLPDGYSSTKDLPEEAARNFAGMMKEWSDSLEAERESADSGRE